VPTLMLTDRQIAAIKPTTTRVEYVDEKVPGLALRVTPNGAKSWTVRYRHRGRLRRLTLGSASVIPLVKARARVRDLLHDASKGADPATEKQAGRKAETIGDLAELYIEKWAKPRKRSWKADDNLLRNKVLPKWRHRAIADVTRQDVRRLVEDVAEAGAPIVANRVAALLSKMFAFARPRSGAGESGGTDSAAWSGTRARSCTDRGRTPNALAFLRRARRADGRLLQATASDGATWRGSVGDALAGH
jgi:hypothetical protein